MHVPRVIVSIEAADEGRDTQTKSSLSFGSPLRLSNKLRHHLINVLHLSVGDIVFAYIKEVNRSFECIISSAKNNELTLLIQNEISYDFVPNINLIVGLIKPSRCEFLIEKCTEIGCSQILFFASNQGRYDLDKSNIEKRIDRFNNIRDSAFEQSHSPTLPLISIHYSLLDALKELEKTKTKEKENFVCISPQIDVSLLNLKFIQAAKPLKEFLENIGENAEINIVIGSEGGFSQEELAIASEHSYVECSLGIENILRTETAAILACGLVNSSISIKCN